MPEFGRTGRRVIGEEAAALSALADRLDGAFAAACGRILACRGRIVCTGMGKSGHIARKIAATLASTGTPAFFMHPGEASHGDLGMVTEHDVVLALSYSGESDEILMIAPALKRMGVPLVAMTGRPSSSMATRIPASFSSRRRSSALSGSSSSIVSVISSTSHP
jgi:arabinose-5-phosphate isomerase